ncbi:hypothetical protein HanPSC8_Chr01g0034941 [Helianthus annuus]|nr:hypothetical protein HanPSC8_Chr01g0034941 [Helianthus annuus]
MVFKLFLVVGAAVVVAVLGAVALMCSGCVKSDAIFVKYQDIEVKVLLWSASHPL